MNPPSKPLSLARIHDVYNGTGEKRSREAEPAGKSDQTTNRFARDPEHTGVAPQRPPVVGGRVKK
jgi:hypothetical protein